MTVRELMEKLQWLPPEIEIEIFGYRAGTDEENRGYDLVDVEGLENGEGKRFAALWTKQRE
jgi:hypothetical protein